MNTRRMTKPPDSNRRRSGAAKTRGRGQAVILLKLPPISLYALGVLTLIAGIGSA